MADEKSLIAAESALVSRLLLASQAGLTFAGARDTYAVLGYDRALNYKGFRQRYLRDDLAQRIVKAFPKATWSTPPEVIEDDDPDNVTDFERAFRDLASRLKLWSVMERLDRLAQIGRYAVLLVGVPGELETEAAKVRGPEGVAYLQAYSEDVAVIDSFVADSASERFGLPAAYKVDLLGDLNAAQKGRERKRTIGARTVHASRVVHFAEDLLDDNVFGRPRLEPVWNRLDDLAKVIGGGAEGFWITANRGMEFALKDGATMSPADATALETEAEEFHHGLRRILRTKGVETNVLGVSIAANGDWLVDGLLAIIAGTTGIPKRILTGSEEGTLASTQDRHNWNERVAERERMVAEPMALRPLIDLWIRLGALPQPKGDFEGGYKIEWPAQRAMTEVEQAQVAASYATAGYTVTLAENVARMAGIEPAITAAEWRDKWTPLPGAAQGESRERKPAKAPEPTEPAPTANAKDPALDQVREAIGRRAQAETWQNAIEAWAMTELAMQGADIIAVFDSLGIVSAWLRSNDEAPLSIEEKAKVEAAIAALKKSWEKRTEKAASPVFEAVITEAGKSAAKGIAADFSQARDAMQAFVEDYSFQFAQKTSETSAEIVRGVLDAAVNEGKTIAQVRADLLTRFTQDVPRAQMIARTETIRASNAGAVEVYKAAGVTLKKWITAGDACPFCAQFDGMTVEVDGNFAAKGDTITADGKSITLGYEDVPSAPLHPHCVLPGQSVSAPGALCGISAFYAGPAADVRLSDGRVLSVTANHLLLTDRGFVRAADLRCGDHVLDCSSVERVVLGDEDHDRKPTTIEQVIDALRSASGVPSRRVPVTAEHLHGDAPLVNGHVHVVGADGLLGGDRQATVAQRFGERHFSGRNIDLATLAGRGDLLSVLAAVALAADGGVGLRREGGPFGWSHAREPENVGLAGCPDWQSEFLDASDDPATGDLVLGGERENAHPRVIVPAQLNEIDFFSQHGVSLTKVESVATRHYEGAVYDLTTETTLYSVNGVVASNCRCSVVAVVV